MPITTAMCTSFKRDVMLGLHNFDGPSPSGDVFKLALIKAGPNQNYSASNTSYNDLAAQSPQDEVAASGSYSIGGGSLTNLGVTTSGTTAYTDFSDISFTSATISADGCMIYNTRGSRAVSVHDFGGTKTSTAGTFTITFPTADASNAIIRIA